jgi:hypothetical protein
LKVAVLRPQKFIVGDSLEGDPAFPAGHDPIFSEYELYEFPSFPSTLIEEVHQDLRLIRGHPFQAAVTLFRAKINQPAEGVGSMSADLIFVTIHDASFL